MTNQATTSPTNKRSHRLPYSLLRCSIVVVTLFAFGAALASRALSAARPPAAPASDAAAQAWKSYPYPADGFAASFPAEPVFSKQSIPTATGNSELHSYAAQDGPVSLIVGAIDFGAGISKSDPQTFLQTAKTGALKNSRSTLISESKITLGDSPGIAFEAETDAIHLSVRAYLVGSTLYQVLVAYPLPGPYAPAQRFFDSFHMIARVPESPTGQDNSVK